MDDDINLSTFELIVMSLSIFVLVSLIIQNTLVVNKEMLKLLEWFDYLCSGIFITEWLIRFKNAKNKAKFTLYNSIDLLASLPIGWLCGLKSVRLVKLFSIIKVIGTLNRFKTYCKNNRLKVVRFMLAILFILLILVSPVMILYFEYAEGSINTAENALWWTYCTVTTIGYGDLYPVTTQGRIFTVFVSLGGIGMFGLISTLVIEYIIYINEKDCNNS